MQLDGNHSEDLSALHEKINNELPKTLRSTLEREFLRLEGMGPGNLDYQRARNHLEFVLELPWHRSSTHSKPLSHASEVLDSALYGLKEVKERVLEYIDAFNRNPRQRMPFLALVGPPGVGKTVLATAIAQCLGRPCERINLAALHNEEQLVGQHFSQPGGAPGKIIQAIHRRRIRNLVIVLEELDHVTWGSSNNPAVPLLEILDPMSGAFIDNYVGVPFDISHVWFLLTANSLEEVPRTLRDRFEVLEVPGYTEEEKVQIAQRFLIPAALESGGVSKEQCEIEDSTVIKLIRRYTRETGVGQLKKWLARIVRKAGRSISEKSTPVKVLPEQLPDYLGAEWFFEEEARKQLPTGVAAGLVWTEVGGEVMYVEVVRLPKGHGLMLTGRLGKVMKESAEAALSYLWSRAEELGISLKDFTSSGVHIHVPAGSISKDGPSAGVTILVALASLYLKKPVSADIAMTGEITLTGMLLPVGAVKEKVLAAHRAGIPSVLLPKQNESDLRLLSPEIKEKTQFIGVDTVERVFEVVFPSVKIARKHPRVHRVGTKPAAPPLINLLS